MIATDEDALICDFAEVYHIYDIYSYPADYISKLASGLLDGSRIYKAMTGQKYDLKTLLLARIADYVAIIDYRNTKDAKTGTNKPQSIMDILMGRSDDSKHARTFESGDAFMEEWRRLNGN